MRILLVSANFAPEPVGIGKYSGEMAEWLAAQGHEVRVVCAPPYYPAWQVDPAWRWPPYRHEAWRGVRVWRAPLWVPSRPGGLKRVLHLASFALASLPILLRQWAWRPEVVMVVAPALLCAPMGWLTARATGARAWLHVQDFEVDVALKMGLLCQGLLRRLALGAESWLLRRFDTVSTISGRMHEHLLRKGVAAQRALRFPNWADVQAVRPLRGTSTYRAELGLPGGARVALFSGSWSAKQGLETVVQAARALTHRPDIVFVVCGQGAMRTELEAAERELNNLRLLPLQPLDRLGELLGLADAHLLPQSVEAEDLVLPSKLTNMLASGRPVVATCRAGTELADAVGRCGVVVPPGDAPALARAIEALMDDPARREALGRLAREHAERHIDRESVLRALEAELLAGQARRAARATP
ncbi:MAG: WcaI family glycosyltransferase [Hydrogenophaga sp.]|uniref:glycosyltransferase WbuB n=1 Tax=Hydrogenophaga sp. TaxID=1904254 RepID=UPI0016A66759|nr:glycosyltransferase WbuB [Hydrogenophaga sp.]NIM41012.1 WcaI family glycosyltransferase [Hydrogenophaga sp.]NIN26370.1 WcaI family glycosyltransferase [Hydrogenophaga sp.]NIN31245.1 WcaI family glycosyltransferase [Hydrogenophaga sp.]NIN55284.1 WcaI family glycosyltransferase [Hydrogenophaga sp.]NIO53668.1 WcaI family glycosyltransferase [Hydrogenophaga sp.]